MSRVDKIEIIGMSELTIALKNLPKEVEASAIRAVARKPANKIVSLARKMFTPKDTGGTKRTFGILKVKDKTQKYIEIGIKGRSLAWVFMLGAFDRKKSTGEKTGTISPIGNVIQKAASSAGSSSLKEMSVDLNKILARGLKKYLK